MVLEKFGKYGFGESPVPCNGYRFLHSLPQTSNLSTLSLPYGLRFAFLVVSSRLLLFMPTFTSQSTGSSARRERRRARQRQRRLSTAFLHRQQHARRSIPRRQLREQSADVDDCFEDCQEFGYHFDRDIHVGSLAAQENSFSVLDLEYSSHSTPDPIPTPYQDHTLRPPIPTLAELDWQLAKESYPTLEETENPVIPQAEDHENPRPLVSKFWWRHPALVDDLEANRSSANESLPAAVPTSDFPSAQTRSITTSPRARATISLSGAFPQDKSYEPESRPSKKRRLNDNLPSTFITSYRIPSPLLYHKRTHEPSTKTDGEDNTCICIGPICDADDHDHQNSTHCRSNGSSVDLPNSDQKSEGSPEFMEKAYRFVAAALPNMSTSITSSTTSERPMLSSVSDVHRISHPYLASNKSQVATRSISDSSARNTLGAALILARIKDHTSYVYEAEDLRTTDTPRPVECSSSTLLSIADKSLSLVHPRPLHRKHELVLPQQPCAAACRDRSLERHAERAVNFWSDKQGETRGTVDTASLNNDMVDYIQDRQRKFQELWDAYEKSVLGSRSDQLADSKPKSVTSLAFSSSEDPESSSVVDLPISKAVSTLLRPSMDPVKSIEIRLPKKITLSPWPVSTCRALVPAYSCNKQYMALASRWSALIKETKQHSASKPKLFFDLSQTSRSQDESRKVVDSLQEDSVRDRRSVEADNVEESYLPWLQVGWDGHLFFPETTPSETPLPPTSLFEDIELSGEGYLTDSEGSGTQLSELDGQTAWWDWDDDDASEQSDDDFFQLEL